MPTTWPCNGDNCSLPQEFCAVDHCAAQQPECQLHETYESVAATATTQRQCSGLMVCNNATEFILTPATTTTNRNCAFLYVCNSTEYETQAPTLTSNRICAYINTCPADEYTVAEATATTDTICSTYSPTESPSSPLPTVSPSTTLPTTAPATQGPTPAPTTTLAPSTSVPTRSPTNRTAGGIDNTVGNDIENDGQKILKDLDANDDLGWIIIGIVLFLAALILACLCSRACSDRSQENPYTALDKGSRQTAVHMNETYAYAGGADSSRVEVNPTYAYQE